MKKVIIFIIILFVGMEGLGWFVYKNSKKEDPNKQSVVPAKKTEPDKAASKDGDNITIQENSAIVNGGASSFPPPSVENVNGVAQRTIHMGVRQWQWDPAQLEVNYGEKVILIIHNADVEHSISIVELGVKEAVPSEGAVVIFTADKRGTFDFFCNTPCGKGHGQMRGKIIVK